MKVLLHVCCAPCFIYPHEVLREAGHEVTGFWYNPNIHPYLEYRKRLDCLKEYSQRKNIEIIYRNDYDLDGFLKRVVGKEERCPSCYQMRLEETARIAKKKDFDSFTTTLLVSPYQKQEKIKDIGEELALEYGVNFYFRNFSIGFREGQRKSHELGLYHQKYCGCIYSEKERYLKISIKSTTG